MLRTGRYQVAGREVSAVWQWSAGFGRAEPPLSLATVLGS